MQVWRRAEGDRLERCYAGDGPAYSPTLEAYLVVVDEGRMLRIAEDEGATRLWRTGEEAEREAREAERKAKEEALARIAELERKLGVR